ncbi:MAG: hypothetical protein E7295_02405 [Lachnospiraceae bacterium]|nr:hypothetical protein [Lachnospiraceae bacterium]
MRKNLKKLVGVSCFVVLGVLLLVLCFGVTAGARNRMMRAERQKAYLEKKELVVREIRDYLGAQGYQNSGVTLTRREYGENEEEYRLMVHHGRIEHLSEEEQDMLAETLAGYAKDFGVDAVMQVSFR